MDPQKVSDPPPKKKEREEGSLCVCMSVCLLAKWKGYPFGFRLDQAEQGTEPTPKSVFRNLDLVFGWHCIEREAKMGVGQN